MEIFNTPFADGVSESIIAALIMLIAGAIWRFLKKAFTKAIEAPPNRTESLKTAVKENFWDAIQIVLMILVFVFYPSVTNRWDVAVLCLSAFSTAVCGISILFRLAKRQVRIENLRKRQ